MSYLPLPPFALYEHLIDKLHAKISTNPARWEIVKTQHVRTRTAFRFTASASSQFSSVFSPFESNQCLAYAYAKYVQQMTMDLTVSTIRQLNAQYFHPSNLAVYFQKFTDKQRRQLVDDLFKIGDLVLQGKKHAAIEQAEHHYVALINWMETKDSAVIIERHPTHTIRSTKGLEDSVEKRLKAVGRNSIRLVDKLRKSEDAHRGLQIKLQTQALVHLCVQWWIKNVERSESEFQKPLRNLWLASDIAFHQAMYDSYDQVMKRGIGSNFDGDSIWYLGQNLTLGAIESSGRELRQIKKAVRDLDDVALIFYSRQHLQNSLVRFRK